MVQSRITPRAGNVESAFETARRDQAFQDRRKLARLQRRDGTTYAVVRWNCDVGPVDLSEGFLCSKTITWHNTHVWIDGFNSLPILRPMLFGDVVYEVEFAGQATRGGITRPLYLPTALAFVSGGGLVADLTITATNVADTNISTGTGSLGHNCLPISTTFCTATNAKFRAANAMTAAASPLLWSMDYAGSATPPPMVLPVSQCGQLTWKESNATAASATSVTVSGLNIDSGEPFDVFGAVALSGTGGAGTSVYSNTVMARGTSSPGVGTVTYSGVASGGGIVVSPAGIANTANALASVSWYNASMSLTLSATVNATTKRITAVTMTVGNVSNLALSVRGGS